MSNKIAYFQGTESPTPHQKKYKVDKAIVVQPRFKEPFYSNYDFYQVPGVNGKNPKMGPGAGWSHLHQYKSISDFLDDKRKYLQDKYKADDEWIEDTDENKQKRTDKMKTRANLINKIVKLAIDFPIDDQIGSEPILGNCGSYADSVPFGGQLDEYLTEPDFEGKSPEQLDFGRDYTDENPTGKMDLDAFMEKYLNPAEPHLYGLPDGISPPEDLDAPNNENPWYGEMDSGNTLYQKI